MDPRRLSTGDILASGILSGGAPRTNIPEDREEFSGEGEDYFYIGDATVIEALEAGKLVKSSNYYGIPFAWKADDGSYQGRLLQYCAVTEHEIFKTAESAAEWFRDMYYRTYG